MEKSDESGNSNLPSLFLVCFIFRFVIYLQITKGDVHLIYLGKIARFEPNLI